MEQSFRDMRIHMRDYEDDREEGMKTFMMKGLVHDVSFHVTFLTKVAD